MKIAVCVKQVPAGQDAAIDPDTGLLERKGEQRLNPYDLFALEAALRVRDEAGGSVTAFSMGPQQAEAVLREAVSMGVDEAVLVCDPSFAGGDVYCTAFTLSQALTEAGGFDLIVCGRQTTDGDTAQTGPALAGHLGVPSVCWVQDIGRISGETIELIQRLSEEEYCVQAEYPCVIAVDRGVFRPRISSVKLKLKAKKAEIGRLTLADMPVTDEKRYGVAGSPTRVTRVFRPERVQKGVWLPDDGVIDALHNMVERYIET